MRSEVARSAWTFCLVRYMLALRSSLPSKEVNMFHRIATWLSAALFCAMFGASIACATASTIVAISGSVSGDEPFPALLRIQATVIGEDPDTLAGAGHHTVLFPSGGFAEHSKWIITAGETDGTLVVLYGHWSFFIDTSRSPLRPSRERPSGSRPTARPAR
jgi:hypothetical protein